MKKELNDTRKTKYEQNENIKKERHYERSSNRNFEAKNRTKMKTSL